ncbi:hypothetical protein [Methylobacterium sp. Leaf117]|uniref:hypothetical protein n=1 Tax=Methylobacterium sp. Leaf117 TaxID=1736260 RepID=UPI001FCDC082|nr:hypothetical protein [Methylobacterium sp. Leaf117]
MHKDAIVRTDHQDALVHVLQRHTKKRADSAQLLLGSHEIGDVDTDAEESDDRTGFIVLRQSARDDGPDRAVRPDEAALPVEGPKDHPVAPSIPGIEGRKHVAVFVGMQDMKEVIESQFAVGHILSHEPAHAGRPRRLAGFQIVLPIPDAPDLLDEKLVIRCFPQLGLCRLQRLQIPSDLVPGLVQAQMGNHDVRKILKLPDLLGGKGPPLGIHETQGSDANSLMQNEGRSGIEPDAERTRDQRVFRESRIGQCILDNEGIIRKDRIVAECDVPRRLLDVDPAPSLEPLTILIHQRDEGDRGRE